MIDIAKAELALEEAEKSNPGPWVDHSKYVAEACRLIAEECEDLCADKAYFYGLLHDIGRYAGVSGEKHLLDGYRYCKERGWDKAAQICISHAFMIQDIKTSIAELDVTPEEFSFLSDFIKNAKYDDYDRLVQLCDALATSTGFCILEKRFIDVAVRRGTKPSMAERWRKTFEIKEYFEKKIGKSIYKLLPDIEKCIYI